MANDRLRDMLIRHEAIRLHPYRDSVGKLTIGVGRNLDDVGISKLEAMQLLQNDIERVIQECHEKLPWLKTLSCDRCDVIYSMVFNMGMTRFLTFKKMIAALINQDYELAAKEMVDSDWRGQVGSRSIALSEMMRTGRYLE